MHDKLKQSSSEINAALLGYYTELQEVFKRFEVAEVMPSPADVKNAFNARHRSDDVQAEPTFDKPDPSNDFYKAFDEFVRVCGRQNDWTHATYEKFAAVKNHLRAFRAELSFSFFNEAGLTEYVRYLREVREIIARSGSNSASGSGFCVGVLVKGYIVTMPTTLSDLSSRIRRRRSSS